MGSDCRIACDGCGRYRGAVTDAIRCLRTELAAKRGRVLKPERTLKDTLEILVSVRELVK